MNTFLSVQEVHGVQVDQIPILQLTGMGLFTALTLLGPAPLSPQKTSRTISVLSQFPHYIIKPIAVFLQNAMETLMKYLLPSVALDLLDSATVGPELINR